MQIIQSPLRVVVVSPVANGVNARNAAALGDYVAPGIIGIAAVVLAPVGVNGDNVSLEIQNVVIGSAVIFQRIGLSGVVIDKVHDVAAPSLPNHLTVLGNVVVGYAVNGFAVTNACQVIGVADPMIII